MNILAIFYFGTYIRCRAQGSIGRSVDAVNQEKSGKSQPDTYSALNWPDLLQIANF